MACDRVKPGEDLDALIADLFDTMYAAPGRGLAAPQIGVMKRVFVMDVTWKDGPRSPIAVVNPSIEPVGQDKVAADEACLSIPGVSAQVARPARIRMRWTAPDGTANQAEFVGAWATCAQHEADHLDGRVIFDRLGTAERARLEAAFRAQS